MGVTAVTFEVRSYYIHFTVDDRVESYVRRRHHRPGRASHSDRLVLRAAHVRAQLAEYVPIAPSNVW